MCDLDLASHLGNDNQRNSVFRHLSCGPFIASMECGIQCEDSIKCKNELLCTLLFLSVREARRYGEAQDDL